MGTLLQLYLYLISICWIIVGVLLIFATDLVMNRFLGRLKTLDLRNLSALPIVCGILLLFAASYNRYTIFIIILGILAVLKGILFIVAQDKMAKARDWWFNKANVNIHRLWGIATLIIGSIVLMGI